MRYRIDAACYSSIGKVRKNNEDNFYFDGKILSEKNYGTEDCLVTSFFSDENRVFAVFDGMGGESRGERASYLASIELKNAINSSSMDWSSYVSDANRKICNEMSKDNRMGTTIAAVQFLEDCISIMNLGDSRIYIYGSDGLRQVSFDHTRRIDKNRKPLLTEHLGVFSDEVILHPYQKVLFYEDVDSIVICSDGITDMVDEDLMKNILTDNSDCRKKTTSLINNALSNGGRDNATVIVCDIKK